MTDDLIRSTSRLFARSLALALLVVLGGCASGGGGGAAPSGGSDYQALYQRREYVKAYDAAAAAYATSSGRERDKAALTAGLASAALEKETDAQRWLKPLIQNPDSKISGTAGATLAMLAQRKSRHTEAVDLLTGAVDKLEGDDKARAAMFCGDSMQALGKGAQAREMYQRAQQAWVRDRDLRAQIDARLSTITTGTPNEGGSFTVQVGAFGDYQRAMAKAAALQPKASAAGLANPRVVRGTKDGKPIYMVRVGRYGTRADGERAKQRLGEDGVVMVASGE